MKILVVDDHELVIEGLRLVLKGLGEGVEVLGAAQASQAFTLADLHPDIDLVMLDFHMPDLDGLQALSVFSKRHPELPVILVSGDAGPDVVAKALQQGAVAFLPKSGNTEELLAAVRIVLAGGVYVSPSPQEPSKRHAAETVSTSWKGPALTKRQQEVLGLLMEGESSKAIGRTLSLSDETVKNHISAIFRILGVQNRTQAAVAAKRLGYVSASESG